MENGFEILMVEDQVAYQQIYALTIKDNINAQLTFANDGEAALTAIEQATQLDLILLDLNIPKKNGEQVLAWIRQQTRLDTVPVIVFTGDTDYTTHCRLLELGANDFIEKGAAPEVFMARLRAQLRQRTLSDRLTRMAIDMDLFAAGVLHDINNLEAGVIAIAEYLRMQLENKTPPDRQAISQELGQIIEQAHHISEYATNVIQRVRDTHREPKKESIDVKGLCEATLHMLSGNVKSSTDAKDKNITLKMEWDGEPINVVGDPQFLQLAVLNILQNAKKYRQSEIAPKVKVSQSVSTAGKMPTVISRFRDNGIGIPKDMQQKIFEPFVRGHADSKEKGFGLGLTMVSKVIQGMGGKVWAEEPTDGLGPGAQICFELPSA